MRTEWPFLRCGWIGLVALGIGCSEPVAPSPPSGNDALGIAEFRVEDTPTKTSVIGLDAKGLEVGRLDLVHGRFALTGIFREEYGVPEVDGRKLDVTIGGGEMTWETAGYEPTLHLPASPSPLLNAFLDDPHVRAVLSQWQIGFSDSDRTEGALRAYTYEIGHWKGTDPMDCSSPATTCGSARGNPINMCGFAVPADSAFRLTRTTETPGSSYNEYLVAQCCPGLAPAPRWFAIKSCPTDPWDASLYPSGPPTSCGIVPAGACKACPLYSNIRQEAAGLCSITTTWNASDNVYDLNFCYESTPGEWGQALSVTMGQAGTIRSNIAAFSCTTGTCTTRACTDFLVALIHEDAYVDWSGFLSDDCIGGGTEDECQLVMDTGRSAIATYALGGTFTSILMGTVELSRTDSPTLYARKKDIARIVMSGPGSDYSVTQSGCSSFIDAGGDYSCTNSGGSATVTVTYTPTGLSRAFNIEFLCSRRPDAPLEQGAKCAVDSESQPDRH